MTEIPRVGVGVLITKDDEVLLGKRKGAFSTGTWCLPGGHLEFMETIADCARRETMEEVGINIKNLKPPIFSEDFFESENKHYLTAIVSAEWDSGEVQLLEPDKFEKWEWFTLDNLPSPLFIPTQNSINKVFNQNHN